MNPVTDGDISVDPEQLAVVSGAISQAASRQHDAAGGLEDALGALAAALGDSMAADGARTASAAWSNACSATSDQLLNLAVALQQAAARYIDAESATAKGLRK